jgi:hypothetical protein
MSLGVVGRDAELSSLRDFVSAQIGVGFGGGVLLALSLFVATRTARPRLTAH